MTLNKDEQEFVKRSLGLGGKMAEITYIIMLHRTRTGKYTTNDHTLKNVQEEFTTLKIEINKIIAKL